MFDKIRVANLQQHKSLLTKPLRCDGQENKYSRVKTFIKIIITFLSWYKKNVSRLQC